MRTDEALVKREKALFGKSHPVGRLQRGWGTRLWRRKERCGTTPKSSTRPPEKGRSRGEAQALKSGRSGSVRRKKREEKTFAFRRKRTSFFYVRRHDWVRRRAK